MGRKGIVYCVYKSPLRFKVLRSSWFPHEAVVGKDNSSEYDKKKEIMHVSWTFILKS